jgi:rubrerythrin
MKTILIGIATVLGSLLSPEKSLRNLEKAYQEEANTSRQYAMFAEKASKEGSEEAAKLFRALSKSDSIHMKNHKNALQKMGKQPDKVVYKNIKVGSTQENLKEPIKDSKKGSMYPSYMDEAKKENAKQAETSFRYAFYAEADYRSLLKEVVDNLGNNKPVNYYVSSVTGEIRQESSTSAEPIAQLPEETFYKY